ncbi:hypothetical protein ACHAXS_009976 [Conticribra weissflogii]
MSRAHIFGSCSREFALSLLCSFGQNLVRRMMISYFVWRDKYHTCSQQLCNFCLQHYIEIE